MLVAFLSACSDSSGPGAAAVTGIQIRSGDGQESLAGTVVPQPILIVPVDANGNQVTGQMATFTVAEGGGTISSPSAHATPDGTIIVPPWTLGKSAFPQTLLVSVGGATNTVRAIVHSDLKVDIRFFGEALTATQQTIFTDAVARLRAIIVGSLPLAEVNGVGPGPCGVSELPAPTGTTDAIVIYAGAKFMDGINGVLGYAKPCYNRSATDSRTVIGLIVLDMADINFAPGDMRTVALHEMVHTLGFGYWEERHLLTGFNTATVAYTGSGGVAGCRAVGGVNTCASAVPVQNIGGPGEANSHWRDRVFGEELMTAEFKTKPVLSIMTIRSLEDLGYVVNPLAADPYTIPSDNVSSASVNAARGGDWESSKFVIPPSRLH